MNTNALIMLLLAEGTVVFFTAYFFWKVLTSKPKADR